MPLSVTSFVQFGSLRAFPSPSVKNLRIITSVVIFGLIAIVAFAAYFYLHNITRNNVEQSLLQQYRQNQVEETNALSKRIEADIDRIVMRLELLAREPAIQKAELRGQEASALLKQAESELSQITPIDTLGFLDAKNVLANISPEEYKEYIGLDRSETPYVQEVNKNWEPHVSTTFVGALGRQIIAIAVPVTNLETGERIGILVTAPLTTNFFERYGNILNVNSQFIAAVDREGTYLTAVLPELVGKNFFGDEVQGITSRNADIYRLYDSAVNTGEPSSATFDVGTGERFATAHPVIYERQGQIMTVILSTPTSAVYSQVDGALAAQEIQDAVLLGLIVAAVGAFSAFLLRWNKSLEATVQARTSELKESNEKLAQRNAQLAEANNQLDLREKLQQEFINVAAHELRTPIQPMLGVTELMQASMDGKDKVEVSREEVEMLARNANRLEKLSSQLLELARIDGGAIRLNVEPIDLSTEIRHIVENAQSILQKDIEIRYIEPERHFTVRADKTRLFEVLSNLLGNAVKFTEQGTITINVQQSDDGKEVIVNLADTGSGIDPDIMPRLFTKFATKSDGGTGIGLYIAKSIIEAHGGRIWAQNNQPGTGATFAFSLPLKPTLDEEPISH